MGEDQVYWLARSRVVPKPAFPYAKWFLYREGEQVTCGLHVEKGYEAGVAVSDEQVLDDHWAWKTFFPGDLTSDAVASALTQIGRWAPAYVSLHAHDATEGRSDWLRFAWSGGALEVVESTLGADLLTSLRSAHTLTELAAGIDGIGSRLEAYWLNLYLHCLVTLSGTAASDCDSAALWEGGLRVWEPWVRPVSRMR